MDGISERNWRGHVLTFIIKGITDYQEKKKKRIQQENTPTKRDTDERKAINKFTGYVFSRLITYAGGEPLQKGEREKEIKSPYVKISGQKISYDCAVYVMKWMELIEPENIKKGKYQWNNWPQVTVFRTI
ncbi:uncharacterized protein LOC110266728 [Arachis ipaensis]|uniref:uncharacterized protein LOC110266728 n=1 Tax=Arachis ipaensis TaxID=130454 RepID=UPI000A2B7781|nr:uncharacterized protein LOC110266728 [Arachis ipaensis]